MFPQFTNFIGQFVAFLLTVVPLAATGALIWFIIGEVVGGSPNLRNILAYVLIIVVCLLVVAGRASILALAGF